MIIFINALHIKYVSIVKNVGPLIIKGMRETAVESFKPKVDVEMKGEMKSCVLVQAFE